MKTWFSKPPPEQSSDQKEAAVTAPVGYLVARKTGLEGQQGIGYDYILAGNGLHVQAGSDTLIARFCQLATIVKGLPPVDRKIKLPNGRIPSAIFEEGLRWMIDDQDTERMFYIRWTGSRYQVRIPTQQGGAMGMSYQTSEQSGIVAEFHSHCRMEAFFSATDDADEQGFRIYGVAGRLDLREPELMLRAGIYGNFGKVDWNEIFEGTIPGNEVTGVRVPPVR